MSVQELNRVHRRYINISNGFKSAWTFHQFLQGLRKVFVEDGPPNYPADFQSVYGELKEVSQHLSESTVEEVSMRLDAVEKGLSPVVQALLAADEQVSPGLLRQFFQRVKNYDDNILSQLVKFYLYFRDGGGWNRDRLDKADYLSTKVCEEYQDSRDTFVLRDRTHVRELAQGFWAALRVEPVAEVEVSALCREIQELGQEISQVESIDELYRRNIVQRYRDFKHRLGDTFFQPKVLTTIVETNLVLKSQIQQLYRRDEQRIVAEYQHIFELERDVAPDADLKEELHEFRQAVDRFEHQLQGENVRFEELAALRERVRQLMPRLKPQDEEMVVTVTPPELREESPVVASNPDMEFVARQYAAIVEALDNSSAMSEPKKVVVLPEVFSLGIETREVVAYRRLFGGAACDRELEEFLLLAAAMRVRIEQDVEEIKGILDDTAVTRDAPAFANARLTVRRAGMCLGRLESLIELSVTDADNPEGKALMVLKMKLMRAYSGLWLMIYKG